MSIVMNSDASKELRSILESKGVTENTIRVFVAGMGWSGPSFNLALDEKKEDDTLVEIDGFNLIAETELIEQFGGFEIKYFEQDGQKGIYVEPAIKSEGGCSSCGGSCGQ